MGRHLNQTQRTTIKILVKFRYLTTDNLALYRSISPNAAYSSLERLLKTSYVGKIHDTSYRLLNKSARYYLTEEGIAYVKKELLPELASSLWLTRKNDAKRSPDFIDEQVAIHAAANQLRALYGQDVQILTTTELYGDDSILRPLPGLLVERAGRQFFVEVTDGQHLFIVRKRIRRYIKHYEEGNWEGERYPDIYFIRPKASDRTRLRKYIEEQMDNAYLDEDDFSIYVVGAVKEIETPQPQPKRSELGR